MHLLLRDSPQTQPPRRGAALEPAQRREIQKMITPEEPVESPKHRCHCCATVYLYFIGAQTHTCPKCNNFYQPISDTLKPVYSQRFLYEKLTEQAELLHAYWKRLVEEGLDAKPEVPAKP